MKSCDFDSFSWNIFRYSTVKELLTSWWLVTWYWWRDDAFSSWMRSSLLYFDESPWKKCSLVFEMIWNVFRCNGVDVQVRLWEWPNMIFKWHSRSADFLLCFEELLVRFSLAALITLGNEAVAILRIYTLTSPTYVVMLYRISRVFDPIL